MGVTRSPADRLLHFLLPAACLGCAEPLSPARPRLGLCLPCRARLVPAPRHGCSACGRALAGRSLPAAWVCGRCRSRPPSFERLVAAWSYRAPLDAVIQAFKFAGLDYLGEHLAREMVDLLGALLGPLDAVVAVPLHWRRRLSRGYNQAECIAAPLAGHLGIPLLGVLSRRRATAPQAGLSRAERLANPRRAFRLRRGAALAGKSLLLVDDVVTTGATFEAAARELLRGGAGRVVALAAARTPGDGEP